jgi:SAM-dependent methyltransferase
MSRDRREGVCQSRLVAMVPSVSVIMSPPVPRLTSNFGNAEDAISTRSRCPAGSRTHVSHMRISTSYMSPAVTGRSASHPSTGEDPGRYRHWVAELAGLLPARARVVDLGCGAGVPGTLALTERGLDVLGVDFSAVQLARAVRLVPAARFVRADMAEFQLRPASVDAVTAFYSLIHLPLADQRALLPRIRAWLRPGGHLLAVVGAAW